MECVHLVMATALQTQLQQAGYYEGEIDGLYGPQTVDGVKRLQSDNGLPPTRVRRRGTPTRSEDTLAELGRQAAEQELTQIAALQTVLTLTGYWTGPIDGIWSDELTTALQAFQTALGVDAPGRRHSDDGRLPGRLVDTAELDHRH